jgi:hypothetical protein
MKKNEMHGACATYGKTGEVHTDFWWGTSGKRPLGRPKHTWEGNVKMDLQEVREAWTVLTWLRIGTCGNFLTG